MEEPSVRLFEPGDLPRLHEIRKSAFAPVFASFRNLVGQQIADVAFANAEADQREWLNTICAVDSGHTVLVSEISGRVLGFVSFTAKVDRRTGEIGLNAVDPGYCNRGIGTRLYEEALHRLKELGVLAVEVGTGADPSHAPARRAYQKAGFGPVVPGVALYRWLGD